LKKYVTCICIIISVIFVVFAATMFMVNKDYHYTTERLTERFWFSACGCGDGSTTNSVSETCVLAETEASNSRA